MHAILVDGNALVWTMYHCATEDSFAGEQSTSAIKSTVSWIRNTLLRNPEAALVVIWDGRAQWRYDVYPGYKSNRTDTEQKRADRASFNWQLPWAKRILKNLPLFQIEHPNAEADDVAWGLSQTLLRAGHFVEVRTDDSDWLQMVAQRLYWQSLRKGAKRQGPEDFKLLAPAQAICEVKAIAGDASDTLDGVPNIADARARILIQRYGDLDRLLAAASDAFAFKDEPKWAKPLALPETQAMVLRNRELVTLARGPVLESAQCEITGNDFDEIEMLGIFDELKLDAWFEYFEANFRKFERPMAGSLRQSLLRAQQSWHESWSQMPRE